MALHGTQPPTLVEQPLTLNIIEITDNGAKQTLKHQFPFSINFYNHVINRYIFFICLSVNVVRINSATCLKMKNQRVAMHPVFPTSAGKLCQLMG